MIDVVGKKWWYFLFSGIIILPGLVSLLLWGLRPSVDFTGGTLIELENSRFNDPKSIEETKKIFLSNKIEVSSVTKSGPSSYIFRSKEISQQQNNVIKKEIEKKLGTVTEKRFETVGPTIGKELTQKALTAVVLVSLAIILYIAWSFRGIPKPYSPFKFGICAVAALIHDALVVVGLFSLLGHFFNVEVDSLFVTALLTVIGFSVHDTIVVFDRIRENLSKMPGKKFSSVVNDSIMETLVRSVTTGLTVLFTLTAMLLFGGETIKWFVVALLVGFISGSYSSILNAAQLLVLWEEKRK